MGKGGGAGKVYFVLYLAVVLELLIIIVERDEAEQGLLKKQKETMRIVESILSQLQSGAGTEGINTRPQDEITILDANSQRALGDIKISSSRTYIVEVGVTDVAAEMDRKPGENEKEYAERIKNLIKLGNVEEIEYQIFYNPSTDPNLTPMFPSDEEIKMNKMDFKEFQPGQSVQAADGSAWELLSVRQLMLDVDAVANLINDYKTNIKAESLEPIYPEAKQRQIGTPYAPPGREDSVFYYRTNLGTPDEAAKLKKRAFVVSFQPPAKQGYYKLRFASRTNRILGVHADQGGKKELDDDAKINIGTVQLTVKDLNKVKKELVQKLEKYGPPSYELLMNPDADKINKFDAELAVARKKAAAEPDGADLAGKMELYGYIAKLLSPGASVYFSQNRGSIEFNVRVITPKPKVADPVATLPDVIYTFDQLPAVFEFSISPWMGEGQNVIDGKIFDNNGSNVGGIDARGVDQIAGSTSQAAVLGKEKYFRGTAKTALSPGEYKVVLDHKLSGKQDTKEMKLIVFKTGLTPESEKTFKNTATYQAVFGKPMFITNAIPTSGLKIKPDQFRTYITTDIEDQRPAEIGYSVASDKGVYLSCKAKKVNLRITWIQPHTGTEIDILPLYSVNIRQDRPKINTMEKTDNVSPLGGNKIRVTARGIKVTKPNDGQDRTSLAEIEVKAKKASVEQRLSTVVDVSSEPTIEKDGDLFNITLDLSINLPRGTDMINGIVSVPIVAQATNKCAGVQSDPEEKTVKISFKYEPEKGGGARRPGAGGGQRTPAPSGGTRRPR